MNFLSLFSNKLFQRLLIGASTLAVLTFAYYKFESLVTNNTVLRANNQQLSTLNANLKLNLKEQKAFYEEQLKATKFQTKFKQKKEQIEKKIEKMKKVEEVKKDDKVINYDDVVNFAL